MEAGEEVAEWGGGSGHGLREWGSPLGSSQLLSKPLGGAGYAAQETATPEPDGTVRLVIAQEDPSSAAPAKPLNWVNPAGCNHGVLTLRIILPQTPPEATIKLVKLSELS